MYDRDSKLNIAGIFRITLTIIGVLILGISIFFAFKVHTEAKATFREAKNVRTALRIVDIEMYALGKTVYDPDKVDGVAAGVRQAVAKTAQPDGQYAITSYSYKKHEVTGMTYRSGNYYVVFRKDGENITWDVTYMMPIYHYDDEDTKIVKK
ncbi:MAG: hypothetical protein K5879_03750 [Lachnospiraceae bacterium]|nr:hypothetical protein [Lachnospiraceae bacterium]